MGSFVNPRRLSAMSSIEESAVCEFLLGLCWRRRFLIENTDIRAEDIVGSRNTWRKFFLNWESCLLSLERQSSNDW